MRPILQDLKSKFSGTDVFVIGGGNSLRGFDFKRLTGKNVVAINSAYQYVDASAILYWGDTAWIGDPRNESGIKEHPSVYKFSSRLNASTAISQNIKGQGDCNWLQLTGSSGYDPDINSVRGNNSGSHSINFAINLGASRIFLLGFDMGYVNNKSHFHDGHKILPPSSIYSESFIPNINTLASQISHMPVQVINCFSQSKLKCFSYGNIEDYL